MAKAGDVGLFAGVDRKIDELLGTDRPEFGTSGTPGFDAVAAAEHFSRPENQNKSIRVLGDIFSLLEKNWTKTHQPSKKLWAPRRTWMSSPKHRAFEVPLERTVISVSRLQCLLTERHYPDPVWFNQIPVVAGLAGKQEGKRCVDLVCRLAEGKYDFIELKCPRPGGKRAAETPLGAAFELLKYAAAYVFVTTHLRELKRLNWSPKIQDETAGKEEQDKLTDHLGRLAKPRELLEANEINLRVLGPKHICKCYELDWLVREVNEDIKSFISDRLPRLRMTFAFEYFDFDSLFGNGGRASQIVGFTLDRIAVPEDWSQL